jgi:Flp pilus assembly protein TadD
MNEFEKYEAQGQLCFEEGDLASANKMFNKAILVAQRDKNIDPHRIAEVLNNAGFTYGLLGNDQEAKRYLLCRPPNSNLICRTHFSQKEDLLWLLQLK